MQIVVFELTKRLTIYIIRLMLTEIEQIMVHPTRFRISSPMATFEKIDAEPTPDRVHRMFVDAPTNFI